jgi:hypothetical protein
MSLITDVRASLAQAPRIVEGLIAAAPREALHWREAEAAWNSVEVLCHLADGEITDWMPRIEKILSEEDASRRSIAKGDWCAIAAGRPTRWSASSASCAAPTSRSSTP